MLVFQGLLYIDFSRLPYKLGAIIGPTNLGICSKGEGQTWTGCLNKRNNGFYCRAGSNSPTHPWQGEEFSVEQSVSEHKLDLAVMNWKVLSLRRGFTFCLLCCVPSFVGWRGKRKGGWHGQKWWKKGVFLCLSIIQLCFLNSHTIIDFLGAVHSLLPFICVNNEYWWLPS